MYTQQALLISKLREQNSIICQVIHIPYISYTVLMWVNYECNNALKTAIHIQIECVPHTENALSPFYRPDG